MSNLKLTVSHYRLEKCSKVTGEMIYKGKNRQVLSSINNTIGAQCYVVDFGWEELPKTSQITLLARFYIKAT